MGISLSKISKGGTPQLWRLISREVTSAHKQGLLTSADLQQLVGIRKSAISKKFFLTKECMAELGIEMNFSDIESKEARKVEYYWV